MRGKRAHHRRGAAIACGALLLVAIAGFWPDAPRGPVDWRAARVVVLESDDWGLCGFLPDTDALAPQERALLEAGRFPPVYWLSTLEDSAAVAALAGMLARHAGRDGLPPVLQANMIVSALSYEPGVAGSDPWRRYDLPDRPPRYARPGLETAVDAGIAGGVWQPELHGAFHYDPQRRRDAATAGGAGRWAAERGIVVFPGSARAWELGHWRSRAELAAELDRSLAVFAGRFGRLPAAVCAPDYVWDSRCEQLWESRGVTVIQAKREQRDSRRPDGGGVARLSKLAARARDKLLHPGRVYLERNCRFEPAQASDPEQAVAACLAEVRQAWARGEPAIIETHRVNYASLDTAAAARGRRLLDRLLTRLEEEAAGPLYLTDEEVASLQRAGAGCAVRGTHLAARNLTRSHRIVALPATEAAGRRAVAVPAGGTLLLPRGGADLPPADIQSIDP